jgi:hypothetical protein
MSERLIEIEAAMQNLASNQNRMEVWKGRHEDWHEKQTEKASTRNWALWMLIVAALVSQAIGAAIALLKG